VNEIATSIRIVVRSTYRCGRFSVLTDILLFEHCLLGFIWSFSYLLYIIILQGYISAHVKHTHAYAADFKGHITLRGVDGRQSLHT
jgi:hypothetical protein